MNELDRQAGPIAANPGRLIQTGVVGLGFGQQVLIPALRLHKQCVVKAVCASSEEKAAGAASRMGIERAYGAWQDMVRDPELDALVIATPASVQEKIALEALRHGKHLFCEKPLSTNARAALLMLEAATRSGTAHMVDFEFPELEVFQQARNIIISGGIGKLRHAAITWNVETFVNKSGLISWKTDYQSGGGALFSFVSHVFYNVEWFLGRISRLSCTLSRSPGDLREADSIVALTLLLESGAVVSVSVCCCAFLGSGHRLDFYGEDGTLSLINSTKDYMSGFQLFYGTRDSGRLEEQTVDHSASVHSDGRIQAVSSLVGRFLTWVESGTAGSPSFKEGYRIQALLDKARRSSETLSWQDCLETS